MLFLISLSVIVFLFNFHDVQVQRGFGYTSDELLILARSYMSVSEDPATGTNQKASAFFISNKTRLLTMLIRIVKTILSGELYLVTGLRVH